MFVDCILEMIDCLLIAVEAEVLFGDVEECLYQSEVALLVSEDENLIIG